MIGIPKPRPIALERADATRKIAKIDAKESAKVKARSGGRCEVTIAGVRCGKVGGGPLAGVHHHLGGWKLRGRGASALAENKTLTCHACHRQIEQNILAHLGGNRYRRAT